MKSELDKVLDSIPRGHGVRDGLAKGVGATIYIDDTGALIILIEGEDCLLKLEERKLGGLKADIDPFMEL